MLFNDLSVRKFMPGQVFWVEEDPIMTQAKIKSTSTDIAKSRPWMVVNVFSKNGSISVLMCPLTTTSIEESKNEDNENPIFVDLRREYAMVKMNQMRVVPTNIITEYAYTADESVVQYIKEYLAKLIGVSDEVPVEETRIALADFISDWDMKKCKEFIKDSSNMSDNEMCDKYNIKGRDIGPLIRHVQIKMKKS